MPVAFYRFETWSLTLKYEYNFIIFKNRILQKIVGTKKTRFQNTEDCIIQNSIHSMYQMTSSVCNQL